jgi:Kef-type K+ transport system membrane component KefB
MQPVPFLSGHVLFLFLFQVGLLLAVAVGLGRLARHVGLPSLVGEIGAGIILGPSVLQNAWPGFASAVFPSQAEQFHLLDAVGQLGVLLLVAFAGTDLDMAAARRNSGKTLTISVFGLVVPLAAGVAVGFVLPQSLRGNESNDSSFVLFVGVALCVSAIPVIAKTLTDMGLMHRNVAQLTLGAAIVDDTVAWFLLSVVAALAIGGLTTGTVISVLAALLGTLLFALLIARPLIKRLMGWVTSKADPAHASAVTVVLVLLSAAGTHAVGLEALLGAFLCGILIRRYLPPKAAVMVPLRTVMTGVLAPVFFATAGLRMDLTELLEPSVALAAATVLLVAIIGKFVGAYIGSRLSRLGRWEAVAVGSALNARGVVEIVIAMTGLRLGVISSEMFTIIVLVAIVTSLMAPPLLRFSMRRVSLTEDESKRKSEFYYA